jgi:S-adenosylmethionine/arginine decarboxylase-like enzyme
MLGVVTVAEMKPMGAPHLDLYTGPEREWDGFSATCHIQTSHITAHFFAFGYVFLDLFSCRPFNLEKVKKFIVSGLKPTGTPRWQIVERGAGFPVALIDPLQVKSAGV